MCISCYIHKIFAFYLNWAVKNDVRNVMYSLDDNVEMNTKKNIFSLIMIQEMQYVSFHDFSKDK